MKLEPLILLLLLPLLGACKETYTERMIGPDGDILRCSTTGTAVPGSSIARDANDSCVAFLRTKGYVTLDEAGVIGVSQRAQLVTNVAYGSPAHEAGIRVDDVITDIDGQAVQSGTDVRRLVMGQPASRISVTVLRDGNLLTFEMNRDSYRRVFLETPEGDSSGLKAGVTGF